MIKNIVLVGLGPHSKRIYIKVLKNNNNLPKLIVDLESEERNIREYLKMEKIEADLFLIPDEYKDNEELESSISSRLIEKIRKLKITHAIISTEPKAHFAYLKFFIQNSINVLSDKPITVVKDMHKLESIKEIKKKYLELESLYEEKNDKIVCKIMCQRRFHKGYNYIKEIVKDVIVKYNIPLTYINIYHCDGKWMMPHDYDIENHPYKYGYGKLFHSGYHFIDLLAEFIKLNKHLTNDKKITNVDIKSCKFDLLDDLTCISRNDLLKIFESQKVPNFYNNKIDKEKYKNYGEKDFYSLMQFKNQEGRTITTANINMLQNGFSRRAWIETKENTYKGNGRIRHESLVIQVGPLLSIQVHSYQSKEIKDKEDFKSEIKCGGLEHFEIYIFRNSELIGGKPFERIQLKDLYDDIDIKYFEGYNELAREDFILEQKQESNLTDHRLAIELLYNLCLSINEEKIERKNIVHIEGMM